MKQGWEVKKLGEVAEVGAGNSAPQDKSLFANGVFPFFRTSDVGKVRIGKLCNAADLLNKNGTKKLKLHPRGTILIPKSGASTFLNHRVIMGVDGYVSSHLATVVADSEHVESGFLLYYLMGIKAQDLIQDHSYPSLNLPDIRNIPIPIPTLPEQKRIIVILDRCFEAIDKAKDNVEHNLQNAKDLFQSQLNQIFTQKGDSWIEKKLGEVCDEIYAGGDAPKENYSKEKTKKYKIPIFANAVKNNGLYGFTNIIRASKPSLTIAARGSGTGHTEIRNEPFFPIVRLIVITPQIKLVNLEFLKFSVQNLNIMRSGSAIPQLTVPMIKSYSISLPTLIKQKQIVQQLDELKSRTQSLESRYQQELDALDKLKKSILQKAFNGELTTAEEAA